MFLKSSDSYSRVEKHGSSEISIWGGRIIHQQHDKAFTAEFRIGYSGTEFQREKQKPEKSNRAHVKLFKRVYMYVLMDMIISCPVTLHLSFIQLTSAKSSRAMPR